MINPITSYATQASKLTTPTAAIKSDKGSTDAVSDDVAIVQGNDSASSSVTLSGEARSLSQLSQVPHSQQIAEQSSVTPEVSSFAAKRLSGGMFSSLTQSDLSLFSDMYKDAKEQGTDPAYVDALAITLGSYRESDNGRRLGGFNEGQFDSEGHQLSSNYSPADTVTADRILNSDAMNNSRLDPGFVRFILQPTQSLGNMANLDFMEQTINKFSNNGTNDLPPDSKFSTMARKDTANDNVVITASKEVIYKPPPTQVANIDGHWFILDKSLWDDPVALKATGLSAAQLADAKNSKAAVALALLGADPKKFNDVTTQLIDLLGKNKSNSDLAG